MNHRTLLVVGLALFCAYSLVEAVRRNDDDEDRYVEPQAESYDQPSSHPLGDSVSTPEAPQTGAPGADAKPGSEGTEEGKVPRSAGGGMIPVITVILASKVVPNLSDAGQMPVLASVFIAPRVVAYFENTYELQNLEGWQSMLMAALVSFSVLNTIVNVGKLLGVIKPEEPPKLGGKAASVAELKYLQGAPVDVAERGVVKIVEFWATWCPPCKKAIPHINKFWKELVSEYGRGKIQLVGITNEAEDKVAPFMKKEMAGNMDYPVALDPNSTLNASYPTKGIPHAFVVGKDGRIVWAGNPLTEEFQTAVRAALDKEMPAVQASGTGPRPAADFEVEDVTDVPEETQTKQDTTKQVGSDAAPEEPEEDVDDEAELID